MITLEFGQQLRQLRGQRGLGVNQLAMQSGVSASQISRIENGKKNIPKLDTLKKLAKGLHINETELISIAGLNNSSQIPKNAIPFEENNTVKIPVVGTIKCGPNGFAMEDHQGYEPASLQDINSDEEYFWLRTTGDSMIGDYIRDGDYALIQRTNGFENGDICAVIVDGEEGTLKHVTKNENSIVLSASNPAYAPRVFVGEEMQKIYIAGKLIEIKHKY